MFMGCAATCLSKTTMSLFGRQTEMRQEDTMKTVLQRKLYIAKESPEPVYDLSECQLSQVPSGTFSMCKVLRKEYLHLNNNKLQTLEHGGQLSDLFFLKTLNISFNKFMQITSDIKFLTNLTELNVHNNCLRHLPDNIEHLINLKILDASNNKLSEITPNIGKLIKLQVLKLRGNENLHELCKELCYAKNLIHIEVDADNFSFPSSDIMSEGTVRIMQYLCEYCDIDYSEPETKENPEQVDGSKAVLYDPFAKKTNTSWEEYEAQSLSIENKIYEAARKQRNKFLSNVMQEQSEIEEELVKIQEARDIERQKLIKCIQLEEQEVECLIKNFMQSSNLKPEIVQQQLLHEQAEHDYLLSIVRQNYDNDRRTDALKSMENILNENYNLVTKNKNTQGQLDNLKHSLLVEDLECSEKISSLLRAKDESHTILVEQLLEDQEIQKAVVASLIEQVDARTWSLNQEISMVSHHLAQLSSIEQEKKKLVTAYSFNELSEQRMQLLALLDDLISQKTKRKDQLLATLKEMETQQSNIPDFWLHNYQKLVESAPKKLLDAGKKIDPLLANYLLQEGVIHCLPFLVKFLFSNISLTSITSEMLKENGVTMSQDRVQILKCIKSYATEKSGVNNNLPSTSIVSSAPPLGDITSPTCSGVVDVDCDNTSNTNNECVICMDAKCDVVFVPCGHLCCCQMCSQKGVELCPMCRTDVERRIRVIPV